MSLTTQRTVTDHASLLQAAAAVQATKLLLSSYGRSKPFALQYENKVGPSTS